MVLNLERNEIKDTYVIGEGGISLCVNDVEIYEDYIYAATESGIYRADINSSNLLDYENWNKVENIPHSTENFSHLVIHSGILIANYAPEEYNQDVIYQFNGNDWSSNFAQIKYISDVHVNNNYMVVVSHDEVFCG